MLWLNMFVIGYNYIIKSAILFQCCISLPWIYCQNISNIEYKHYTHIVAILMLLHYINNMFDIYNIIFWDVVWNILCIWSYIVSTFICIFFILLFYLFVLEYLRVLKCLRNIWYRVDYYYLFSTNQFNFQYRFENKNIFSRNIKITTTAYNFSLIINRIKLNINEI